MQLGQSTEYDIREEGIDMRYRKNLNDVANHGMRRGERRLDFSVAAILQKNSGANRQLFPSQLFHLRQIIEKIYTSLSAARVPALHGHDLLQAATTSKSSGNVMSRPTGGALQCPKCHKSFNRNWLLKGHLRTHTGERPFKCDQCSRTFADNSNLRAHKQTHSEVKRFECTNCHRRFALKSYLSKHKESACGKYRRGGNPAGSMQMPTTR